MLNAASSENRNKEQKTNSLFRRVDVGVVIREAQALAALQALRNENTSNTVPKEPVRTKHARTRQGSVVNNSTHIRISTTLVCTTRARGLHAQIPPCTNHSPQQQLHTNLPTKNDLGECSATRQNAYCCTRSQVSCRKAPHHPQQNQGLPTYPVQFWELTLAGVVAGFAAAPFLPFAAAAAPAPRLEG